MSFKILPFVQQRIHKMVNHISKLAVSLLFILFSCVKTADWQGIGNMSISNLTEIWEYIQTYVGVDDNMQSYYGFCKGMSDHLNDLWHPAWNVVTLTSISSSDAVLYGYAFRDHWMWYNNYPDEDYILGFVIWKDYNCDRWLSLGDSSYQYTGFSNAQLGQINNAISAITTQWNINIWIAAANFMESLASLPNFSGYDKAFTVVMSQNYDQTYFYSRLCVKSSNFFYLGVDSLNQPIGIDGGDNNWGNLLLFQTR